MTVLIQLKELETQSEILKNQVAKEIEAICEKYGDVFDYTNYYGAEVWIYLNKGVCISTNLFKELDSYFEQNGNLSYSTGDGFVVVYRIKEVECNDE